MMTTRLVSMQVTMTASLVKKLDEDAVSVAVTTDIWTSLANDAHMSFTTSYVSREWQLNTDPVDNAAGRATHRPS